MANAEDPVADFLARESEQMAGLEDDLPIPANGLDATSPESEGPDPVSLTDDLDDFAADGSQQLADEFGAADLSASANLGASADLGAAIAAPEPQRMQPSPITVPRIEPEKIRKWREEQKIRLEKKDVDEEKKKEEWKVKAKKELEDWYANRADTLQKTKKSNRSTEEETIRDRDAVTPGQEWERIGKLCEFNPKNTKNTKDVSRMRGLLLQLKSGQKAE